MKLDKWQEDVLKQNGNICLCTGRQVGKSTVIAIRAGEFAVNNKNKNIMIIAAVERQALLLFEKVLSYIHDNHKHLIKKGKERPSKHVLKLKNGSTIHCLPTGMTGYGIRGYTIDDLYADEAHFIPEDVWAAVTPMLATTGGRINLLSTADLTKGKEGYFYRCSLDEDFSFFSISTIEVAEGRPEPQRTQMLEHISKEKNRLTKAQYQAEYLGMFVDAMMQFFSNKWIDKVCSLQEDNKIKWESCSLGMDIAGMGDDATTFESLGRIQNQVYQIGHQVTTKTRTTETIQRALDLDLHFNYNRIGVDDGGMGVGVFDHLLKHTQTKRKVIALNNSSRVIQEDRKKKLLKEDMYNNLLGMGERGDIQLYDNDEIKASLRSIHSDPESPTFRLTGQDSHIAEGLIRAAYLIKEKSLNPWISSFSV